MQFENGGFEFYATVLIGTLHKIGETMPAKKYVLFILVLTAMSTIMCQRNTVSTEPPQATSAPVLTGKVAECSLSRDGYISFLLANALTEETFTAGIRLTLNGEEVDCRNAGNTMNLLICRLPSGTQFPVQVIVTVGDVTTDDFSYDGSACVLHPTPQTP